MAKIIGIFVVASLACCYGCDGMLETAVNQVSDPRIAAMDRVLREDMSIATSGVVTATETEQRMRRIDLSGCPEDFRDAFILHISNME